MRQSIDFSKFINDPNPLWDLTTTRELVRLKWEELRPTLISDPDDYSTAKALSFSEHINEKRYALDLNYDRPSYLELPSFDTLGDFYDQNALILTPPEEIESSNIVHKLNCALALFKQDKALHETINLLVRVIQVVNQSHPEIDISHSDPKIPFSIFVSVCEDSSPISNLRVAESILHEAMHLKLTLLEAVVPLVNSDSSETFYSPWREEPRPIRGVLHGIFVFRAIHDFYTMLLKIQINSVENDRFVMDRIDEIKAELNSSNGFEQAKDLTLWGTKLVEQLLNRNILK